MFNKTMENPSLFPWISQFFGIPGLGFAPTCGTGGGGWRTSGHVGSLRGTKPKPWGPLSGMPKDQPYTQRGAPVYDSEVIKLVYIVYSYCFTRALGFIWIYGACKGLTMPVIDKIYVHQGHSLATLRAALRLVFSGECTRCQGKRMRRFARCCDFIAHALTLKNNYIAIYYTFDQGLVKKAMKREKW